jgi:hypothetical protein
MTTTSLLSMAVAAATLIACAGDDQKIAVPSCAATQLDALDGDVLAATMAHVVTTTGACRSAVWNEILVQADIVPSQWTSDNGEVRTYMAPLTPPVEAVDNFLCRNQAAVVITEPPLSAIPVQLVRSSDLVDLDAVMDQHPNGALITLSLPGYESAGTAVVYYARICSTLGGQGHYALLRYDGGAWRVDQTVDLWIS